MQEELVSFETAVLAKEKGFVNGTKGCFIVYKEDNINPKGDKGTKKGEFEYCKRFSLKNGELDSDEDYNYLERPTQSLLQKWLREVHQIYIQIETDQTTYPKFCYSISRFIGNPNNLSEKEWYWDKLPYSENWSLHRKYEEALEEGLQEALKLIEIVKEK